jgi:peptide/nickel transport system substrate-binding protein
VRTRPARFVTMLAIVVIGLAPVGLAGIVAAQETPRPGGELVFVVPAEPPSFDAHREESFSLIHPAAPHYSTLLRVDPDDPSGTKIVGDLAESWSSAPNGRTWTFKIRRGVKFHDGSELTARDVKASYDKIVFPPAGVASNRKGEYVVVEAVEAPDAATVVFRLKWPAASFLASLAWPFNWIYKAEILNNQLDTVWLAPE